MLAPHGRERLGPTQLSNILNAADERVYERYGLDPAIAIPRLRATTMTMRKPVRCSSGDADARRQARAPLGEPDLRHEAQAREITENGPMGNAGTDLRRHWDAMYETRGVAGVSWYEPEAATSLALIGWLSLPPSTPVIDIGGGASTLVDVLTRRGFCDLTVVDISERALQAARERLGHNAQSVQWVCANLLAGWRPTRRYGLWHDRAVFHFFVDDAGKDRYRQLLGSALADDGVAIVATFAADGPDHCSGLPVARYGPDELVAALGNDLVMLESRREEHMTPAGILQPFTWVAMRRATQQSRHSVRMTSSVRRDGSTTRSLAPDTPRPLARVSRS